MSAPLRLTSDQLLSLAKALDMMTKVRQAEGVAFDAYQPASLRIGDNVVEVAWDDETSQYRIDDRNGS